MINDNNILMVAMAIISGILTDIYRRFAALGHHKEAVIRMDASLKKQESAIIEMKDDIKYLVRKEIDRSN